jgi:hypothetical protein
MTDAFSQRDVIASDTMHPLDWVLVKIASEEAVIASARQ